MVMNGNWGLSMVTNGYDGVIHGYEWLLVVMNGYWGLSMVMSGYLCL